MRVIGNSILPLMHAPVRMSHLRPSGQCPQTEGKSGSCSEKKCETTFYFSEIFCFFFKYMTSVAKTYVPHNHIHCKQHFLYNQIAFDMYIHSCKLVDDF